MFFTSAMLAIGGYNSSGDRGLSRSSPIGRKKLSRGEVGLSARCIFTSMLDKSCKEETNRISHQQKNKMLFRINFLVNILTLYKIASFTVTSDNILKFSFSGRISKCDLYVEKRLAIYFPLRLFKTVSW